MNYDALVVVYLLSVVTLLYRTVTVELRSPPGERFWNNGCCDWIDLTFIALLIFLPVLNSIAAALAIMAIYEERK